MISYNKYGIAIFDLEFYRDKLYNSMVNKRWYNSRCLRDALIESRDFIKKEIDSDREKYIKALDKDKVYREVKSSYCLERLLDSQFDIDSCNIFFDKYILLDLSNLPFIGETPDGEVESFTYERDVLIKGVAENIDLKADFYYYCNMHNFLKSAISYKYPFLLTSIFSFITTIQDLHTKHTSYCISHNSVSCSTYIKHPTAICKYGKKYNGNLNTTAPLSKSYIRTNSDIRALCMDFGIIDMFWRVKFFRSNGEDCTYWPSVCNINQYRYEEFLKFLKGFSKVHLKIDENHRAFKEGRELPYPDYPRTSTPMDNKSLVESVYKNSKKIFDLINIINNFSDLARESKVNLEKLLLSCELEDIEGLKTRKIEFESLYDIVSSDTTIPEAIREKYNIQDDTEDIKAQVKNIADSLSDEYNFDIKLIKKQFRKREKITLGKQYGLFKGIKGFLSDETKNLIVQWFKIRELDKEAEYTNIKGIMDDLNQLKPKYTQDILNINIKKGSGKKCPIYKVNGRNYNYTGLKRNIEKLNDTEACDYSILKQTRAYILLSLWGVNITKDKWRSLDMNGSIHRVLLFNNFGFTLDPEIDLYEFLAFTSLEDFKTLINIPNNYLSKKEWEDKYKQEEYAETKTKAEFRKKGNFKDEFGVLFDKAGTSYSIRDVVKQLALIMCFSSSFKDTGSKRKKRVRDNKKEDITKKYLQYIKEHDKEFDKDSFYPTRKEYLANFMKGEGKKIVDDFLKKFDAESLYQKINLYANNDSKCKKDEVFYRESAIMTVLEIILRDRYDYKNIICIFDELALLDKNPKYKIKKDEYYKAWEDAAILLKEKKYDEILKMLGRVIEKQKDSPEVLEFKEDLNIPLIDKDIKLCKPNENIIKELGFSQLMGISPNYQQVV
ncbi:hypothetical protein [Treponema denticola]|uniref:hypothetical protein n=1 Tax=Treponema denticola TaxID=158 RepID=UPI0020A3F923|nr:hypothetical protein [Treponema denticola]UTC86884.1 hypothetical protein E4N79_01460 [Treponema denticola]